MQHASKSVINEANEGPNNDIARHTQISGFSNPNYLPRPHHDLQAIKQWSKASSEQPALTKTPDPNAKYEPVPDSRFYTKANFFSI